MVKQVALITGIGMCAFFSLPLARVACGQGTGYTGYTQPTQCDQLQQYVQGYQSLQQQACAGASQNAYYAYLCNYSQQMVANITQQAQQAGCPWATGDAGGDNGPCSPVRQQQIDNYISQAVHGQDSMLYSAVSQFEDKYEWILARYVPQSCYYIQYCNPPAYCGTTEFDCTYQGYVSRSEILDTIYRDMVNNVYITYIAIVPGMPASYSHKLN